VGAVKDPETVSASNRPSDLDTSYIKRGGGMGLEFRVSKDDGRPSEVSCKGPVYCDDCAYFSINNENDVRVHEGGEYQCLSTSNEGDWRSKEFLRAKPSVINSAGDCPWYKENERKNGTRTWKR